MNPTTTPSTPSHRRRPWRRSLLALLAAAALAMSACGSDPIPISAPAASAQVGDGETAQAAPARPVAGPAASDHGEILVNVDGFSLYGFTDDVDGISTCFDGCASAWPPVLVDGTSVPAGLDTDVFSVVARPDGTHQLKAGMWPLYLFAGDTAPGQTTGHLSGDVWFLAAPDGSLIDAPTTAADEEASVAEEPVETAALVSVATVGERDILVDAQGLSIYGFTNDVDGVSVCFDGCAEAWPPILTPTDEVPPGLDSGVFSVVARPDGTHQLKAGRWPLYLFAGDTAPGQTSGHLSGDVWFLAAPDGSLIDFAPAALTDADADAAPAEAPAADGYGQTTDDSTGGGYGDDGATSSGGDDY